MVNYNLKVDKATFMLIVTIWNLLAAYIGTAVTSLSPPILTIILGAGNAIIVWLGVETGNETPTATPAVAPSS